MFLLHFSALSLLISAVHSFPDALKLPGVGEGWEGDLRRSVQVECPLSCEQFLSVLILPCGSSTLHKAWHQVGISDGWKELGNEFPKGGSF